MVTVNNEFQRAIIFFEQFTDIRAGIWLGVGENETIAVDNLQFQESLDPIKITIPKNQTAVIIYSLTGNLQV